MKKIDKEEIAYDKDITTVFYVDGKLYENLEDVPGSQVWNGTKWINTKAVEHG